jgi:hypothetical protein
MAKPNYVCTVCSQTFTRKWRGTVHNDNLHGGLAKVVRLIDYMIGRSNGEYLPSDPLIYRRKRKSVNRKEYRWALLEKAFGQESHNHQSGPHPTPARNQQFYVTDSRLDTDFIQRFSQVIIRSAELKRLLSQYLPPKAVQDIVSWVSTYCMTSLDIRPLNKALAMASDFASTKESLEYLMAPLRRGSSNGTSQVRS